MLELPRSYVMKHTFYLPLTAAPFRLTDRHREILPQNPELAKYIRCFWGSETPYFKKKNEPAGGLVIPDTCTDILYHIDHTENEVMGCYCGINDTSFFCL